MNELLDSFSKSISRLLEVLKKEPNTEIRDAAIQRFEFTFELAWKTLQKYLREQGIICQSPRECIKEAFKQSLISDDPIWLNMIEDRNLTSHTYNEMLAKEVFASLPEYAVKFSELEKNLTSAYDKI
jgi:nucleotidyltransferase substrate binding protein (TIGR01987 family)